ncbi:beta-klotho [Scleropages formosus]|uniref:beta-klotho n=1 Tax=Scleropages formosus TaxID=113540 RepID=UPI0010FA9F70|nr:beta-klotho [Scleropages formosus]
MTRSSSAHAALALLALLRCAGLGAPAGRGREVWRWPAPGSGSVNETELFLHATFPPGFLWGTGSSAFQTEGAWDQEGKGPSIWDNFTRSRAGSAGPTADTASASYQRWKEDVAALKLLGVHYYSFSLSWPRLFPDGDAPGTPNPAGVAHYSRLIDHLRREGIEPVVTLYHWDLPLALQEQYGGWLNDTLVDVFDRYAAFCFRTYGERVRYWVTIHNPYLVAWHGYRTGLHAPGETESPAAAFAVAHNLIKAHAKAWHTYDRWFRARQRGRVSIALGTHWMEPLRGQASQANVDRCQESLEAVLGWFAEPIHGTGTYPASLRQSRSGLLPELTDAEKQQIRGTADFFALSFGPNNLRLGRILSRFGQQVSLDLRRLLNWIRLEYDDPAVFVAENGWFSDAAVGTEDTVAIYLMKKFINQVLQAIIHDGVRVIGYTAWSLVDGFEWNYGYGVRRGLFYVDFGEPSRSRLPKTSAFFYKQVISNHGFPDGDKSLEVRGQFPCGFHWGVSDSTLQVHFSPFSPQFTDPKLYRWNLTGDGALRPVPGVQLETRAAQCTDFLAIQKHVRLLEAAGVDHYRFALNWTLILPRGDLSVINTEALRYYRCMAQELQKRSIKSMVTLYYPTHHAPLLGLPASVHSGGGWLNRSTVEAFREYAELCFRELGPWVPFWITVNEPNRLSQAYDGSDPYLAAHHLILAHVAAWRLYDREFRRQQGALVSFSLHADWAEAANPFVESHRVAAERFLLFELACFLDPLLGAWRAAAEEGGDYPEEVREHLQERRRQGLSRRSLPRFTKDEKREARGALDFVAVNHFTTRLVSQRRSNSTPQRGPDHDCQLLSDPTWPSSPLGQSLVPWGLRRVLRWLRKRYGDPAVIVTATGVDDRALRDDRLRQFYLRSYLQEALKAHQMDGVNIKGFYLWNLQDRHHAQFGLFTSSQFQSGAKASVASYREIIANRGFPAEGRGRQCQAADAQEGCVLCGKVLENRALVFFGTCLLLTFTMLTAVAVTAVKRKRKRTQPRTAPNRRARHRWDRVPLHHLLHRFHDNCL